MSPRALVRLGVTERLGRGLGVESLGPCRAHRNPSAVLIDARHAGEPGPRGGSGLGGLNGATDPTSRTYRITVTLEDDNAAQAKSATAGFTWEAQNV